MIYANYYYVRNVKLIQYLQLSSQQCCKDYNYLLIGLHLSLDYYYLLDYDYHLNCFTTKYRLLISTLITQNQFNFKYKEFVIK